MFFTKLKIATALLLLSVAVVAAGASLVRLPVLAAEPPQPPKTDRPAAQDGGKPQTAPKPVVVREDAFLSRLAWSSGGEVVATIGITYEVVEIGGKKVLVGSSTIKLWDASTGKLKRSLEEEKNTYIKALAFSPDKKTVAIAAWKPLEADRDNKTEVRLVDAETWALKHKVDDVSLAGVLEWSAVAFSPDGKRLAMGGYEKGSFVKLWDVQNKKLIEPKAAPEQDPGIDTHLWCLAFSPDGKVVAAGDRDAKIRLFDGQTGEPKAVLDEHSATVLGIAFSPDGKTLVSGSADKTAKLWDVPAGKLRQTLKGNKGNIFAVAFSPDGRLLVTGGAFMQEKDKLIGEVILWDAKTGELKQTLPDMTVPVYTLAFSPDGKTLAIGGGTDPVLPELKDGGKTSGEMKLFRLSP